MAAVMTLEGVIRSVTPLYKKSEDERVHGPQFGVKVSVLSEVGDLGGDTVPVTVFYPTFMDPDDLVKGAEVVWAVEVKSSKYGLDVVHKEDLRPSADEIAA